MKISRRSFLQLGGLVVAGIITRPVLDSIAKTGPAQTGPGIETKCAMVIDTNACTAANGCTLCVNACHTIHNVPDFPDPKDQIQWARILPVNNVFTEQEHESMPIDWNNKSTIVFCNHCENPPCVRVCPTGATWKRKDGIVMMDYHRCIGCRYCMAACPYGSRNFNWRDPKPFIKEINPDYPTRTKGVVEKCNFCEEKLAIGQIPACVEACPEKAMFFGNLNDSTSDVSQLLTSRFSLVCKPSLGTKPKVFFLV